MFSIYHTNLLDILIILITAILANAVPIIRDLPPEPNIPPNGDSNLSEDVLHRTSNPSEIYQRFYRASDPNLDTHVSNLKKVARITNGIYLIQGITSGTIDSDELISELLRFGHVKLSDISAIDISKVESAIDDMKSLPVQLVATTEMGTVEKVFDGLKAVLAEVDGIGNLTEWTHEKEHFKQEINRLAENGLNRTDINLLRAALVPWTDVYTKLTKKTPAATTDNVKKLKQSLEDVKTIIQKILEPGSIWQFINFTSAADGISTILKADRGVDAYLNHSRSLDMDDVAGKTYTEYMESMKEKLSNLMGRMDNVNIASKLLASRGEVKRQLHYTFGLPKGALDLSRLPSDIFDPWIAKVVKTKRLEVALGQLKGLAALSKEVDDSIGNDAKRIRRLVDIAELISDFSNNIDSAKSGIAQGYNCTKPYASDIDKTSFTALNKTLQEIDAKLDRLRKKKDELSGYVQAGILERCNEIIAICEKMTADGSNSPTIVKELEVYEHLADLGVTFRKIDLLSNDISNLITIDGDAKAANSSMDSLNKYHDKISTKYSDYFKCLQNQHQLKFVFEAIDGLKQFRGWKDDTTYSKTLTDGLTVVKKVADIKSGLDNMKTSIKELSELKTPETDALKALNDASTHSQVIGNAVQGLSGMAEVLEQDNDLRKVVDNIGVVESGKQKTKDPSLNELVKLSKDITPMLASLTTFSTSLAEFSMSDTLVEQSDIFSSAKKVPGVTGVFSSMIRAVEELKEISPLDAAQLTKVEDGLKKMDLLDLDFAGFHKSFDDSKDSLTAMDLFFAKTRKKFEPTTPIPTQRPTLGLETSTGDIVSSGAQSAAGTDEEKKEDNDALKYAGGSVAFFLVTLAIVFFLLYKFQRPWLMKVLPCLCWKKKQKPEPIPSPLPPVPPNPAAGQKNLIPSVPASDKRSTKTRSDVKRVIQTVDIIPPRPALPTPEDLLKIFIDYLMAQFEAIRLKNNLETVNTLFCNYEFYKVGIEADKVIVDNSKIVPNVLTECRSDHPLYSEHRPVISGYGDRFTNDFLHANILHFKLGMQWIMTETPQIASDGKNSTVAKFWWLAKQYKTQSIAMFTSNDEIKNIKCDQYYPQKAGNVLKIGDLTLKCTELKKDFGDSLEIRTITGSFGNEPPFTVTQYVFTGWPASPYPSLWKPLLAIYTALKKDTTPAIIHCVDGVERTGMFALSAYMVDYVKRHREVNFKRCYQDVVTLRPGAVNCMSDYAFCGRFCLEMLADETTLDSPSRHSYTELKDSWDRIGEEHRRRENGTKTKETTEKGESEKGRSKEKTTEEKPKEEVNDEGKRKGEDSLDSRQFDE
ncbi:hypothetical protein GCK72_003070 [Caenorhabditis remanei]|uniref:Tyrosine-protein phosphatase domain-containing protein n=1 Tax=Caenorhabditis remanei TaxID=31234 RepID=A0A6A5HWN9_CAERE|nr:hypothetical protein GCK72_003070 [Caenorhabditis remanei]KAF1771244.1 hypothetical protein GCK72_003070 [Caenorhabditis remanei]